MSIEYSCARVLPPIRRPGTRAHRLIERNLIVYRRIWIVLFSGFFEPVFYLLSIGVGVGFLVNQGITLSDGRVVTYTAFVAPALLASSAMNGAVYESTLNVFFRLKWGKVYDGILATPLQPLDIALGEIAWSQIRGCLYAIGFTIVMAMFGLVTSLWGVLAVPDRIVDRLCLRRRRDGGNHLHEGLAGLRPHPTGDPASVPVLRDLLPDQTSIRRGCNGWSRSLRCITASNC